MLFGMIKAMPSEKQQQVPHHHPHNARLGSG